MVFCSRRNTTLRLSVGKTAALKMLVFLVLCCLSGALAADSAARIGCRDGWYEQDGYCFWIGQGEGVSSRNADDACSQKSADLVEIDSSSKHAAVKAVLNQQDLSGVDGAIIDGTYIDGQWWYLDQNKVLTYYDWADSVNGQTPEQYDCIVMDPDQDWAYEWANCENPPDGTTYMYICESSHLVKKCTDDSCYALQPMDYSRDCGRTESGYLARVQSLEENDFVKGFIEEVHGDDTLKAYVEEYEYTVDNGVYIDGEEEKGGATDDWYFSNGEEMTYFDWAGPEPNESSNDDHCIIIDPRQDFEWNDKSCVLYKLYLCENDLSVVIG